MQNTKILVFGRMGQVGWELRHKLACLGQVTAIEYPEIDFSKPDSIRTAMRQNPRSSSMLPLIRRSTRPKATLNWPRQSTPQRRV
jgi:hypothetical protein